MRTIIASFTVAAVLAFVSTPAQAQRLRFCHIEEYSAASEFTATDHTGCKLLYAYDTDLFYSSGGFYLTGVLTNIGNFTLTGSQTISGTLAVTGATTFAGALTPNGGVDDRPFSVSFNEGASKGLSLLEHDGTVYSTTADAVNYLVYGGTKFLMETLTTAAGTVTPIADANGLDIQGSSVGIADEWALTTGQLNAVSREIIPGTTPAWKACATWKSTVVLRQAALFLEVTTPGIPVVFSSSDPNYSSYAAIGQLLAEIYISDNTTGPTDTTDNWANTETYAVCILSTLGGVITYTVDGSAPSATDAHTLADGVPHIIRLQGLTVTGTDSKPLITEFSFEYQ